MLTDAHTHTHTHSHTYSYSHIHTHKHTFSHALTFTHIHTHSHTHIHSHTHPHALTPAHTHSHTSTPTPTHTHTQIHTHSHTYTHTHCHPHTHIHTFTHILTLTHSLSPCYHIHILSKNMASGTPATLGTPWDVLATPRTQSFRSSDKCRFLQADTVLVHSVDSGDNANPEATSLLVRTVPSEQQPVLCVSRLTFDPCFGCNFCHQFPCHNRHL